MNEDLSVLAEQIRAERNTRTGVEIGVSAGLGFDPDKYAKAVSEAARTGIAPATALKDLPILDRDRRLKEIMTVLGASPGLAGEFSDPNFSALAHDDVENLAGIERGAMMSAAPAPTWTDKAREVFRKAVEGTLFMSDEEAQARRQAESATFQSAQRMGVPLSQYGTGNAATLPTSRIVAGGVRGALRPVSRLIRYAERKTGLDTGLGKATKSLVEALTPSAPTVADTSVENFTSTLGLLLPGMGAKRGMELVTKIPALSRMPRLMGFLESWAGPVAMAVPEAASEAEDAYDKNILNGKTKDEANAAADKVFAANLILLATTDKIAWFNKGVGNFRRAAAEAIQEGGQQIIGNVATGDKWHEGVGEAALMGAGIATAIPILGDFAGKLLRTRGGRYATPLQLHQIDVMAQAAAASKLRERAPEVFQTKVAQILEGKPAENMTLDAQAFQSYFQSQNIDPAEVAKSIGIPNYQEALASGTDLVVPTAAYLTQIAPEHHTGLSMDLKLNPADLSMRELEAFQQEQQKAQEELKKQGAEAVKDQASEGWGAIYQDTYQQLVDVGDSHAVADARAAAHATAMVRFAERSGMDPIELHDRYGLTITGPMAGESRQKLTDVVLNRLRSREERKAAQQEVEQGIAYDNLNAALTDLGIDPMAPPQEIRRRLYEASQAPETAPAAAKAQDALKAVGQEVLFQRAPKPDKFAKRGLIKSKTKAEQLAYRRGMSYRNMMAAYAGELRSQMTAEDAAFAAFNEELKAIQAGTIQQDSTGNRGFIQWGPDRKMQIGLLEGADLSTFTHEVGHLYLEIMGDLVEQEGASPEIQEDWAKILKFLGVENRSQITTKQHEKWARAHEAYFMEGKAPSEGLRDTFARVKSWMLMIYRRLQALGVRLNDDVRGVFDRLYASQAEIEAAKQTLQGGGELFSTAQDMGVSQAEFDLYRGKAAEEIRQGDDDLAAKLMGELRRQKTKWWNEQLANVTAEVRAEIEADPYYQAFNALTSGKLADGTEIRLNKQSVIDQFGQEAFDALPKKLQKAMVKEGGVDAEAASEVLGLQSGDALILWMQAFEPAKDRIKRLADERMKERHGDMLKDGTVAEEAMISFHNDARAERLRMELKALRRAKKEAAPIEQAKAQGAKEAIRSERAQAREVVASVPPIQTFRDSARELLADMPTMNITPHRYIQAQRKHAREAFKALGAGDYKKAAEAKQKELLNHFLYVEAVKIQDEVQKSYRYVKKFGKASVRERIAKAGGTRGENVYLDPIDQILERFQFVPATNTELRERQKLIDFLLEQNNNGETVALDTSVITDPPKNYRQLTIGELRAVTDALRNLESIARNQLEFIVEGKRVDFQDAIQQLTDAAYRNNKATPPVLDKGTLSTAKKAAGKAKRFNSQLLKMEELLDRLDGEDPMGPWKSLIFYPMALAQYREAELQQSITAKVVQAMEEMPAELRKGLTQIHDIPGLGKVTKAWILSVAMNTGNESNQEKLIKGMGWAEDGGQTLGKVLDKMTRQDWEFVQKVWDSLETLWPEIEALELRTAGIVPERVERRPFSVSFPDGSSMLIQGGYYPMVYDPERSGAGKKQGDVEIMTSEGGYRGPATSKGHTKERVNFSAPLLLDFEHVLTKHISRVVKDISHREAAKSVAKLLMNQEVRDAIQTTLGAEYEAEFLPWLQGTVNDVSGMNPEIGKWMLAARSNMVIAGLAFRASSVAVQATDLGRVMVGKYAVSPMRMMEALGKMAVHPFKTIKEVRAKSKEMAGRADNLDRDLRAQMRKLVGKDGALVTAQRVGMAGLAAADAITSTTAWLGAYNQALAKGKSEAEAIRIADTTVRLKMMSGAPKDLTALQRDPGWGSKMISTYMGDAVAAYGILSNAAFDGRRNWGRNTFAVLVASMVLPVLGELIKGKMPDDDEDKLLWAAKKAAFGLPSSVPVLRDVMSAVESGRDYSFTPLVNTLNKGVRALRGAANAAAGEAEWDGPAADAAEVLATLAGIPGTSQVATTLKYLKAVSEGEQTPETPLQFVRGAVFGPAPKGGR